MRVNLTSARPQSGVVNIRNYTTFIALILKDNAKKWCISEYWDVEKDMGKNPSIKESAIIQEEKSRFLKAYEMVRDRSNHEIRSWLKAQEDNEYRADMAEKLNISRKFRKTGRL